MKNWYFIQPIKEELYGEEVFEPPQMAKKDYGQDENRASSRASSRQQFQKIRTSRQDSLRDPLRERQVIITHTYIQLCYTH